ncbi:MAG: ParB N-terminal domain-containing protein [Nitrososphaerales archaeon]
MTISSPSGALDVEVRRLPLAECEPYPGLTARLDEDLAGLTESIRANGQRDPGKAVPRKDGAKGYWVYDGRRRLACCKDLYALTGSPATYDALVYEQRSEEDIYVTSILSNESGRNERKNLSLLEEIALLRDMAERFGDARARQLAVKAGRDSRVATRSIELGQRLWHELPGLAKVEKHSDFRFRLTHLEDLLPYFEDRPTFYKLAAIAAQRRVPPGQIPARNLDHVIAYYVPWFAEAFPGYVAAPMSEAGPSHPSPQEAGQPSEAPPDELADRLGRLDPPGRKRPLAVQPAIDPWRPNHRVFAEDVYLAGCPHCGAQNPFQVRPGQAPEVTFMVPNGDGNPQKETVSPDALYACNRTCPSCGLEFSVVFSQKGPDRLAISTHKEPVVAEPEAIYAGGILAWDDAPATEDPGWVYIDQAGKSRYHRGKLSPVEDG